MRFEQAAFYNSLDILTPEQERFLWLHARTEDRVTKWAWHMSTSFLRAYTERGNTATISAVGLDWLCRHGLVERGSGIADVQLTEAGKVRASK